MILANLLIASSGLTITLPPSAEVQGNEVFLAEIATLKGDAKLIQEAESISLGWAPNPGYSRRLFAELIEQKVEKALGGVDVALEGESTCRVWPCTSIVTGSSIETVAREWLEESTRGREAELVLASPVEDLTIPKAQQGIELVARMERALVHSGRLQVPVEVRLDGFPWRSVWTQWEVNLYERRPALVRDLPRGQVLTQDDLKLQRVRITQATSSAGPGITQLVGAVALRDLRRGTPIQASYVRFPIAIKKGASVTVEVRSGRVQASGMGVALEEGSIGDSIRIATRDGSQSLQATIVARGVVRVTLR